MLPVQEGNSRLHSYLGSRLSECSYRFFYFVQKNTRLLLWLEKKDGLVLQGKRICVLPNIQQVSLNHKAILGTHLNIICALPSVIRHLVGEECSFTSNIDCSRSKQFYKCKNKNSK